jgi:hypothetical protein
VLVNERTIVEGQSIVLQVCLHVLQYVSMFLNTKNPNRKPLFVSHSLSVCVTHYLSVSVSKSVYTIRTHKHNV